MAIVADFKNAYFWRAVFTEFFATTIFLLVVTMQLTGLNMTPYLQIVVAFSLGITISVLVQIFGPISGAHINPAVTFGVLIKGDIGIIKALFYIIAQLLGGILGSAITYGLTPEKLRGSLGNLTSARALHVGQGFVVEMIFTMTLVFTVLASTSKDNNRGNYGYTNALAIGFSITFAHLVAIPYTGTGINPARALGPAVVTGDFVDYHWIYHLGPCVGAAIAALLYRFVFSLEETTYHVTGGTAYCQKNQGHEDSVTVQVSSK